MLADLTHSSSCSPVSLSKWKSMLLSPHITSIYATMVTWFMGVLDRMVWGRGCSQNRSSCLLDYWTLLEWLLMTFGVQAFLQPSPIGEIYPCAPCPNVFLANFLIMLLPSPWPFSQTIAHSQWISEQSHIWPFLLPRKMYDIHCLKFYPLWRFFSTKVLHSWSRKVCPLLQLSTSGWCWHSV